MALRLCSGLATRRAGRSSQSKRLIHRFRKVASMDAWIEADGFPGEGWVELRDVLLGKPLAPIRSARNSSASTECGSPSVAGSSGYPGRRATRWWNGSQILEGMHDLRDAFLDVADHAAVCLSEVQKAGLLNVISFWANEMDDGYDGLPEGVYELRNALHDDLHHVGVDVSDD